MIAVELDQSAVHGRPAPVALHDLPVGPDEYAEGYSVEVVSLRKTVREGFERAPLDPVHPFALHGACPCFPVIVHGDRDDLESLRMISLIGFFQMGDVGPAGTAPAGPELQQHVASFARIVADAEWLALRSLQFAVVEGCPHGRDFGAVDHVVGLDAECGAAQRRRESSLEAVDVVNREAVEELIERLQAGRVVRVVVHELADAVLIGLLRRFGGVERLHPFAERTGGPSAQESIVVAHRPLVSLLQTVGLHGEVSILPGERRALYVHVGVII